MSRQSRLSDMTMDADAEEMRLDYMLKKGGIMQRTRLAGFFLVGTLHGESGPIPPALRAGESPNSKQGGHSNMA